MVHLPCWQNINYRTHIKIISNTIAKIIIPLHHHSILYLIGLTITGLCCLVVDCQLPLRVRDTINLYNNIIINITSPLLHYIPCLLLINTLTNAVSARESFLRIDLKPFILGGVISQIWKRQGPRGKNHGSGEYKKRPERGGNMQ